MFRLPGKLDKHIRDLLKRIILVQVAISVIFPTAGFFIDEEALSTQVSLPTIISFELAVTMLVIVIEIIAIMVIYLRWKDTLPIPVKPLRDKVIEMIKKGENSKVEFKQTLRWDMKEGKINKDLERVVIKSIAGFLNNNGGHLLIGVADRRNITGLNYDYESLPKRNNDGFENHIRQLIKSNIGINFMKYIKISFVNIDGKFICFIKILPSDKPVYVKNGETEDFYIRNGNTTNSLTIKEAVIFINDRFNAPEAPAKIIE